MHAIGIRGQRFNLVDLANPSKGAPLETIRALSQRIAPRKWHTELLIHADDDPAFDNNLYTDWLKRDDSFVLQPHEHLARILRFSGKNGKADTVLFEKKEEQRKQAWCEEQPSTPPCEKRVSEALWPET